MVNQTMSAQWEVVGKSNKKVVVPTKKLSKTEKKKFVENAPKIEDILPLDQIRTLYNVLDGNKAPKKPQPTIIKEEKKPKKKAPVVSEKKNQGVKEKPVPKTLEAAAKQLDVKELISVVEVNQARFPDAPVLWVKGVAEYLNVRLAHSGTATPPRPQDTFLSLLPFESRDVLHKAIKRAGPAAMNHFFEHSLSSMVTEMSKGNFSVYGYKIILQLSAAQSASALLENPSKVQALWKSFQSKQPIGLAILWALGQLGSKDVTVGLIVWQELMGDMLEMRNYSAFVASYLKMLSTTIPRGKTLTTEELTIVMDIAYSPALNLPVNIKKELHEGAALLLKKSLECKPESRPRVLFQPLLERLIPSAVKPLEKELVLTSLAQCLKSDPKCFIIWQRIYPNHTEVSARLLQYLRGNGHWKDLNVKLLRETLVTFQTANRELAQYKQLSESVTQCQTVCEEILPKLKMTVVRKSFPWRFGSFLLILAVAGVLAFDVQRHGSFDSSSTGRFLRDVGALPYVQQAWTQTRLYSSKGATWATENVPVYYQMASETSRPYLNQAREATLVAGSYLNQTYWGLVTYTQEKAPLVEAWCNQHVPGLVHTQAQIIRAWGVVKEGIQWLGEAGIRQSHLIIDWAKTNVFVGGLSPEKLQQFSKEAINTTQEYAFWTYQWVVDKYHTLASVQ